VLEMVEELSLRKKIVESGAIETAVHGHMHIENATSILLRCLMTIMI
jgi:hypothetical protein